MHKAMLFCSSITQIKHKKQELLAVHAALICSVSQVIN